MKINTVTPPGGQVPGACRGLLDEDDRPSIPAGSPAPKEKSRRAGAGCPDSAGSWDYPHRGGSANPRSPAMNANPGRVVVIGAGPAGAALSYLLARRGVHVTLLEKHVDFARAFR